jgi:hypothetical protein
VGKDITLLLLGVLLGVLIKALVDPRLERRKRTTVRKEQWLEDCMARANDILNHISEERSQALTEYGYGNMDAVTKRVVLSLTQRYSPGPLAEAAREHNDNELTRFASSASEAFMAVSVARGDIQHSVEPAEEQYDPMYALQWYTTQLSNFASAARRRLGGESTQRLRRHSSA